MNKQIRIYAQKGLSLTVAVSLLCFPLQIRADETSDALSKGILYLQSQANDATRTMAFSASGNDAGSVDYLKSFSASDAISYAKPILALTSAGKDPATFPAENFIEKLRSYADDTQLGNTEQLNDDMWGIFALASTGVSSTDSAIQKSKQYLLDNQNDDGGWGWSKSVSSDTNDTAFAVAALLESGVLLGDTAIQNAKNYLKSSQNDDGGFPYDPRSEFGTASDANSTAAVLQAINALGESASDWQKNGKTPIQQLLTLQDEDGGFWWQAEGSTEFNNKGATGDAVIALAGKWYPVKRLESSVENDGAAVSFRIEGKTAPVCKGLVIAKTALDVVKNSAEMCGFAYEIQTTGLGPYVVSVGGDLAEGEQGWLYRVNWNSPEVGSSDYTLKDGDEVLWYYEKWDAKPLRLVISNPKEVYAPQEKVFGKVESFEGAGWNNAPEADVKAGGIPMKTGEDGLFELQFSQGGAYEARAEKAGFVRSAAVTLIVADVTSSSDLSVEIVRKEHETVEDETESEVRFTVSPAMLNFGKLEPGKSATQAVQIQNAGGKDVQVQASVQGDEVFYFLKLNDMIWSSFALDVQKSSGKQVEAKLSLPAEFGSFGAKQGKLIFWGTAK